jgi:hypothetical protein
LKKFVETGSIREKEVIQIRTTIAYRPTSEGERMVREWLKVEEWEDSLIDYDAFTE